MDITKLKINPNNPQKFDDLSKLKASVKDFPKMLPLRPLIYDPETMEVLGGNKRLICLQELGFTDVPADWVKAADELTAEEKQRFIIADNVGFGTWDEEILSEFWDSEDLSEWGLELPDAEETHLEAEEDNFEINEETETDIVLGDIIEIGNHRLMCGDSTDSDQVAKLMNGVKADMVFTDPPYNIDYQGVKDKRDKIANDKMSDDDFTQFLYDALNINCDTFYVCCSWQYSHLFRKALEDLQKPVKSFIVWDKVNPAQHLDKYFKQHEIILYHGKFGGQKTLRGDVWQTKRQKNTVHPTMKPIELIETALNDNADKKNIYDAFLGSGSTMVAAHQLNRKCYGMELDSKYCQVIVDRMRNLDPDIEIKVNGIIQR